MQKLKKIIKVSSVFIFGVTLLCSCQSTKSTEENQSDLTSISIKKNEDSDDENNQITEDSDVYIDEEEQDLKEKEKKKENSFLTGVANFFTNNNKTKYLETGTFNLSTTAINLKLKTQEATYLIDENNSKAGFGSGILSAYYIVLMDKSTRIIYQESVSKYLSDFENKKLTRRDKKSEKKYGKSRVTLNWGTVKGQTHNYGDANVVFGYTFKNDSPYFSITVYPTVNELRAVDEYVPESSMNLQFYFTKAQCKALSDFLEEKNLNEILYQNVPLVEIIEADEY